MKVEEQNNEQQNVTPGIVVESNNQSVKIPMKPQIPMKEEAKSEAAETTKENQSQLNSYLDILKDKVTNLESMLQKADLPDMSSLLKEFYSFSQFYNEFKKKCDELSGQLQKEVSYTRTLENQIKMKQSETEILELKRALEEDRAKFSISLEQIERALKDGLNALKNLADVSVHNLEDQVKGFNNRLDDLKKMDATVNDTLEAFRKELLASSKGELIELKGECCKNMTELKSESVKFLKTCEKHNKELIKKIPNQTNRICLKDILIYGLCVLNIVGWMLMWIK